MSFNGQCKFGNQKKGNTMKRRIFFKTMGATAALAALPLTLKADDQAMDPSISTDIGNNHGHELQLSLIDALVLLKETRGGNTVEIDIQGQSGHPHSVQVDEPTMVTLLAQEAVSLTSSKVSGHSHPVSLLLELPA